MNEWVYQKIRKEKLRVLKYFIGLLLSVVAALLCQTKDVTILMIICFLIFSLFIIYSVLIIRRAKRNRLTFEDKEYLDG